MRLVRVALVCLPTLLFLGCPEPVTDPCEAVNCGAGRCVPTNGQASCLCDTTYVAQGLTCVPQSTAEACANNPCAATGKVCSAVNGQPICSCPSGYIDSASGCVKANPCNPNPCTAANQSCQATSGAALCVCNAGYTPVGNGCSADPVFDCNRQHSGGAADDQYEPNECPSLSTPYDLTAAAQSHTIAPAGDEDWIRIAPEQGHIVSVDFSSSTIPLYVDVYGEDGVTPVASDHRGINNPSFRFVASTLQTHYVRVRALRANDTGSYTLTLADTGVDDFANQQASALSIAAGGTFAGEVQYTGDVDVVRMPVEAGHTYRLLLATTTTTGIVVEVVGTDGTTVRKTMDKSLTANTSHTVYAKAAGSIFLRAKAEATGSVGTFSVSLTDVGLDDHGDLLIDATTLTPSTTNQSGMFETRASGLPVDIDVFTFQVQAGHIYSFTCSAGPYSYGCTSALRDASGVVLTQLTGGSSSSKTLSYEATAAGTLNVSIQPYSTSTTYIGAVTYKLEDLGADDHGDDRANATALTVGTPKGGRIESAGDLDYFSFTATAARIYQVGCTPDTTLAYCAIRVLDSSGLLVTSSSSTTGIASFEATASGTYYVEAKAYSSGYLGNYSLSVTDSGADDHGDTDATATALTLGTAKSGNLELGGDVDVFSISATANNIYSVNCTSSISYHCYMTVKDPGGATVITTSYGTNVTTGFRATSSGTYTVQVRGYYSTTIGAYAVTVTSSGADDHTDTATGATALTVGTAASGNIQFSLDKDFFSFNASAGRLYKVSCTTSASYLCVLNVRNPSGTLVASTTYGSATGTPIFEAAVTGAYTVETTAYYSGYTGTYTVTVTDEGTDDHGDTAATATSLTVGGAAQTGKIELAGDYDFFSFNATANKIYRFTCAGSTTYLCVLNARNAAGTLVANATYGSSTSVRFAATATEQYTIEVRAYSTSYTGTYTYQLFDDGTDDHGDTAATATALTVGTAASGNIQFANDKDIFSFSATAGRVYQATCTTTASYLCMLTVRNPAGTAVVSVSYGNTTTTQMFEVPTAGTYTVETTAYYTTASGAYSLTVTDQGVEDHGDTAATATSITAGAAAATGRIEFSYDVDYFSFSGTANHIYRFTCTSTVSYQCVLTAKNAAGTTLTSASYGTSRTITFVVPTTDTYFVEVKAYSTYSGTYTYQLFDDGVDDFADTAALSTTTAAVPSTVTGSIQTATDKDVFKFTAASGILYRFACTSSDSYGCQMTVRDATGSVVSTSTYGTSVTFSIKALSSGTFSVEMSNYYGYTNTWSVGLSEIQDDHGDTQATSTGITTGVAVGGVLEYAGDFDYFAVNLNASQSYSVAIGSSPTIYAYVTVYNSAGTTVLTESYTTPRSFTATTAGTYYVRVRPYSSSYLGNYTLTVQ